MDRPGLLRREARLELAEGPGEGAGVIAALGIGLDGTVRPRGHVMLGEKAADTAHVAVGRSPQLEAYGGRSELP